MVRKNCFENRYVGTIVKNLQYFGYKHPNLTENIREWQCPECKTKHDRHINAAINIKKIALSPPERRVELEDSLTEPIVDSVSIHRFIETKILVVSTSYRKP